jgi:DNA excision repair protein ERCC-2
MALVLSKMFMRKISQNPNENQTGISLWTLEDVEKAQAKQREMAAAAAAAAAGGGDGDERMEEDEEDEYWKEAPGDEAIATMDL